jgi:hypothetical protein
MVATEVLLWSLAFYSALSAAILTSIALRSRRS